MKTSTSQQPPNLTIQVKAIPKHKKITNNTIATTNTNGLSKLRIPRPIGITMLSMQCNSIKDPNTFKITKNKLIDHYINTYIAQGYKVNGLTVDINTISNHLGITQFDMFKRISRLWKIMGQGLNDQDSLKDTYNGIIAILLQTNLEDRGRIVTQYETLNNEQGTRYVPFLSSTLNQTLKLLLESQAATVNILKAISPNGTGPNITINNENKAIGQQANSFTINEAINLLEASTVHNLLGPQRPDLLEGLKTHYLDDGVPEINATLQESRHDKALIKPEGLKKIKDNSHENHRLNSEGLDEDFEIVE